MESLNTTKVSVGFDASQIKARQTVDREGQIAAAFLDALPLPALGVKDGTEIILANGAAQDLFLKSIRSIKTNGILGLFSQDSPIHDLLERARVTSSPVSARDMKLGGAGFGDFMCDITASPSEDGSFVAVVLRPRGRGRDLSERMQDMAGARSMAALGRTLAHEVKNPLAGIRGAAQLLLRDADPGELELVNLIVEETDRVRRLIDRMESFGADPPIEFASVNVHAALERVAALAENGFARDHVVKRLFDPSLPEALGDEDQLIQVFLNLAKNAAEATHTHQGGAEIILATAYRHGVRIRTASGETRDLPLEIAFYDNGRGVSDDVKDCLFEPFVSTKPSSGGLGLPLVQKIVNAHGGVVDFESEPGRTVFRVRLPVSTQRAGPLTAHYP
ncbi:two-component system sensor histidine kinase NtrB [Candidatus Phycosocius spiralis]|uniref:two-component system sensor histidine kinase NtrB n=1 Tax=Candidatus Phycosocius spiralis TaxID=2815099 RepID=UPI0024E18ED6|nr:ATP-binding protein [Candidatus Phycosocius spiralis]